MIHKLIKETMRLPAEEVMELIGAGDIQTVHDRRERINKFLETNEWDHDKYKVWLRGTKYPSVAKMASNVAGSAVSAARSGFESATEEVQEKRLSICKNDCEFYRGDHGRCALCGCSLSFKARLKVWKCPDGRW